MTVAFNDIGFTTQRAFEGVKLQFSNDVDIEWNQIGATRYGINYGFNFSATNSTFNNNTIELTGFDNTENIAINTFVSTPTDIQSNTILGNNQKAAIATNSAPGTIANNEIFSDCENGIAVLGSRGSSTIEENNIASSPDNGIFVLNSMGNIIDDNDITASSVGLFIRQGSDDQSITCNRFLAGINDIRNTGSVLGIQSHHNNEFREHGSLALQFGVSTAQSKFLVDRLSPNLNTLKPEDFNPGSGNCFGSDPLFECTDADGENMACSGNSGHTTGEGENDVPCHLTQALESLKDTDEVAYWVKYRQILKEYSVEDFPCILCYCSPSDPDDCGLLDQVEKEQELESVMVGEDVTSDNTNRYNQVKRVAQEQLIQMSREDSSSGCENEAFQIYRGMYTILLNQIVTKTVSKTDKIEVIRISNLCPERYGEAINWARGLRSTFDSSAIYDDSACGEESVVERKRDEKESLVSNQTFTIHPNPTSDNINLTNSNFEANGFRISSISGKLLIEGEIEGDSQISIDVSGWTSGLYILNQLDSKGQIIESYKVIKS